MHPGTAIIPVEALLDDGHGPTHWPRSEAHRLLAAADVVLAVYAGTDSEFCMFRRDGVPGRSLQTVRILLDPHNARLNDLRECVRRAKGQVLPSN